MDHAEGAYVWDVDGRRMIDCLNGFGTVVLGHRPTQVLDAVAEQMSRGPFFGFPVAAEAALASLLTAHVPGAEKVVFVGSGTEATLGAMRLARAATGRQRVAKFEGGWHGWHDSVIYSFTKFGGEVEQPESVPNSLGLSALGADSVVVLPFNDERAFDRIRAVSRDLSCVIVEGIQCAGGCMVADPDWLRGLRDVCNETGVLLILDEVITGFRLGLGGAAEHFGVTADLTTLGKTIGAGFPVGAIVGKAALLEQVLPNAEEKTVVLSGTFAAHPVSMAAGLAQLEVLSADPSLYDHLNGLGDRLRAGLRRLLSEREIVGSVSGAGSVWGLHLGVPETPRSIRDLDPGPVKVEEWALPGYLLKEDVLIEAPIHLGFLSTAHTEDLIDEIVDAHERALSQMMDDGFLRV